MAWPGAAAVRGDPPGDDGEPGIGEVAEQELSICRRSGVVLGTLPECAPVRDFAELETPGITEDPVVLEGTRRA